MGTLNTKGTLFPQNGLYHSRYNSKESPLYTAEIEFEIDERKLEKEIEKKLDTALVRALKTINGK